MKSILLLFVLLSPTIIFSKEKAGRKSVSKYYEFKYKAENNLVDSNYNTALKNYRKAFSYKYPNNRDIYNALVAAIIVKDSMMASFCFSSLVLRGLEKGKLEQLDYFASVKDSGFYKWISSDYEMNHEIALRDPKYRFVGLINAIIDEDRSVREDSISPGPAQLATKRLVDSLNREKVIDFVAKNGFAGFDRVVLFDQEYSRLPFGSGILGVLWNSRLNEDSKMQHIAREAVLDGQWSPDDYALTYDLLVGSGSYYCEIITQQQNSGNFVFKEISQSNLDLNKRRTEMLLEPLSDYKKKLAFLRRDRRFHFYSASVELLNAVPLALKSDLTDQ